MIVLILDALKKGISKIPSLVWNTTAIKQSDNKTAELENKSACDKASINLLGNHHIKKILCDLHQNY